MPRCRSGSPAWLTTLATMPCEDPLPELLLARYWSGDALRTRSVSRTVHAGRVDVAAPPARLWADWERDVAATMEAGDVDTLPLARARMRWPDYPQAVQAAADWTRALGLENLLASCDVALMACRGARYHHDGAQYGGAAFCNLFLSEDKGLDVHFPGTGDRIPLRRGTVLLFDTGQPHGVVRRERKTNGPLFDPDDYAPGTDCTQVFLTWELPIEDPRVAHAMGIVLDPVGITPLAVPVRPDVGESQIMVDGAPALVCPTSGRWRREG